MKKNEKGFSAVEVLIVIVIVGLVGAGGWLVYDRQTNSKDDTQTNTQASQQQSTEQDAKDFKYTDVESTPTDWKQYKNDKYSFSLSYPKESTVREGEFKQNESADKAEFFMMAVCGSNCGYEVRILDTTLADAVNKFKSSYDSNDSTKIKTEDTAKNDYKGVKVIAEYSQKEPLHESVSVYFFYEVKGKVYEFSAVYEKDKLNPENVNESKMIFNSLELK